MKLFLFNMVWMAFLFGTLFVYSQPKAEKQTRMWTITTPYGYPDIKVIDTGSVCLYAITGDSRGITAIAKSQLRSGEGCE